MDGAEGAEEAEGGGQGIVDPWGMPWEECAAEGVLREAGLDRLEMEGSILKAPIFPPVRFLLTTDRAGAGGPTGSGGFGGMCVGFKSMVPGLGPLTRASLQRNACRMGEENRARSATGEEGRLHCPLSGLDGVGWLVWAVAAVACVELEMPNGIMAVRRMRMGIPGACQPDVICADFIFTAWCDRKKKRG